MGNSKSVFSTLASSNHSDTKKEIDDYYATEPKAVELLLERENFSKNILEPFCGEGHISKVLEKHGYNVKSTDKIYRGYGSVLDFFTVKDVDLDVDIISNPPYSCALSCVKKSLEVIGKGHKLAMLLKIQFLEGKERRKFFDKFPPKYVYVASSRLTCAKNGDFDNANSSAICYAWYIWEKGYKSEPIIRWIN